MQLSVIIVNYNVKYFLEHCLYSVQKAILRLKAEIIVVDNASSDGSMEYLLEKFPQIEFIDNPENIGFARANNQALGRASGKYILFLNPDTILPEDCLEVCIHLLESKAEIGACGIKMIDGSGRFLPESKRGFPSVQTSFYKLSGLSRLFPRSERFAKYHLGHLSPEQNSEIDVLSGAFFIARRHVLKKTGGFDERFFMYGEDIDLSYRIQLGGYKNFYLAETCIVHFKGESTRKETMNYVKPFYKAMSLFVKKHYSGKNRRSMNIFIEPAIWFSAALSATKNLFQSESPDRAKAILNTMIIATVEEKLKIVAILAKHHQQRNLYHLVPSGDWEEQLAIQVPDEIIFAEGTLSYKAIISQMQKLPKGIMFSIFSSGANSIIGSSSKNSHGYRLV